MSEPPKIPRPPETEAERKQLRAACKYMARKQGLRKGDVDVEATRLYYAAIEAARAEAQRARAATILALPGQPKGMKQTKEGLWLPG